MKTKEKTLAVKVIAWAEASTRQAYQVHNDIFS
jgi:hypothetical protein